MSDHSQDALPYSQQEPPAGIVTEPVVFPDPNDSTTAAEFTPDEGWIESISGQRIYIMHPDRNKYIASDVAHALAAVPRFAGHTLQPLSVLDHSINVAQYIAARIPNPAFALAGLLHDASEAYFCDIPSPVKACFPAYREMMHRHDAEIVRQLIPTDVFSLYSGIPDAVKDADFQIYLHEVARFMYTGGRGWASDGSHREPLGFKDLYISPTPAAGIQTFLSYYHSLVYALGRQDR